MQDHKYLTAPQKRVKRVASTCSYPDALADLAASTIAVQYSCRCVAGASNSMANGKRSHPRA